MPICGTRIVIAYSNTAPQKKLLQLVAPIDLIDRVKAHGTNGNSMIDTRNLSM